MDFPTSPRVKIYVLPGGIMPKRQRQDDIGYDAHIRAVVSPSEMDSQNSRLRQTLFNFRDLPTDPLLRSKVEKLPKETGKDDELVYRMDPGETVTVGIGIVTELPPGLGLFLMPRSGLASRWGIIIKNAPGVVDPGYRGEACAVIVNQNHQGFDLRQDMRIVQLIFQWVVLPEFIEVEKYADLSSSKRAAGGLGSTGLFS